LLKSQKETENTREEFEKTTKAIEKQEAEIKELKTQKEGLEKKLGAEDMSKAFGKLGINFS
jgi:predicted  nucleic acid-binding Zn-ribbon protein